MRKPSRPPSAPPPVRVEVRLDRGAVPCDLVGALASLLLSRARRAVAERARLAAEAAAAAPPAANTGAKG